MLFKLQSKWVSTVRLNWDHLLVNLGQFFNGEINSFFNCFCVFAYFSCGGLHLTPATWHLIEMSEWENKGHLRGRGRKVKETNDLTPE